MLGVAQVPLLVGSSTPYYVLHRLRALRRAYGVVSGTIYCTNGGEKIGFLGCSWHQAQVLK